MAVYERFRFFEKKLGRPAFKIEPSISCPQFSNSHNMASVVSVDEATKLSRISLSLYVRVRACVFACEFECMSACGGGRVYV